MKRLEDELKELEINTTWFRQPKQNVAQKWHNMVESAYQTGGDETDCRDLMR